MEWGFDGVRGVGGDGDLTGGEVEWEEGGDAGVRWVGGGVLGRRDDGGNFGFFKSESSSSDSEEFVPAVD